MRQNQKYSKKVLTNKKIRAIMYMIFKTMTREAVFAIKLSESASYAGRSAAFKIRIPLFEFA